MNITLNANGKRGHEYPLSHWNTKSPDSYFTNIDRFRTLSDIALLSTSEGQWFRCSALAQEFIFINHCNIFPHHSTPMAETEVLISSLFWMWWPISSSLPRRRSWIDCSKPVATNMLPNYHFLSSHQLQYFWFFTRVLYSSLELFRTLEQVLC